MVRRSSRQGALLVATVGLAVVLVACGSDNKTSTAGSQSSTTQGTTATSAAPATTTTTAAASLLKTATNATFGTILTDASGKTLYTRDNDPAGGSTCTAGCLTTWPALLVPAGSSATLKAPTGVTAALTSFARTDGAGTQVLLGGKALYTYSGDAAAGDTKGDGVGGVWHVAKAA
jgi:predicted lipoprotein with Yx(FWY)xxD motif